MGLSWSSYLIAALVAAFITVPFGETAQAVALLAVVVSSIVFMVRGCRRNEGADPWLWYGLSVAAVLFLVAGVIADYTHAEGGVIEGYPHLDDFIDLAAYVLAVVAMYRVIRVRARDADPTGLLDAMILPGGIVIVLWALVWVPSLQNDALTLAGHGFNWSFAVLSISLTGIIAQFVLAPGRRSAAFYLLGVVAIGALGGDVLTAVELSGRSFAGIDTLALLLPTVGFTGAGAAALHPAMAAVSNPYRDTVARLTFGRLLMLSAAALVAPVLLLTELRGAANWVNAGTIGLWAAVVVLIMLRMAGLVHARERIAASERVVAETAEALVVATESAAMYSAALDAMERLAGPHGRTRVSVLDRVDDEWHVVASRGHRSARTAPDLAGLDDADSAVAVALTRRGATRLRDVPAPDLAGSVSPHSAVMPLVAGGILTGATVVSTDRELTHATTTTLEALSRDLSLALEASAQTERNHQEQSERRFRGLIENSRDLVFVVDGQLRPLYVTPAASRVLGYPSDDLLSRAFTDLLEPDDVQTFRDAIQRDPALRTSVEIRLLDVASNSRYFDVIVSDQRADPGVGGLVVTARDIHARKLADERTTRSQERFRSLVQHGADIVAVVDDKGDFSYVSPSAERILGYSPEDLEGRPILDIVHVRHHDDLATFVARVDADPATPHSTEIDVLAAWGETRTVEATATNLDHEESIRGTVINAHDITERIKLERSLRHQALHDDLTGIPNRVLFHDRIEQAITRRNPGMIAVMVLDLDDFKTVNDGLGHQAGDDFLKILAFRLRQVLRVGDTAARLGGDEFAILIEDAHDRETVVEIAERMLTKVAEPFDIGVRELTISCSIGVAFAGDLRDPTGENLIRSADAAMYEAKTAGKGGFAIFEESMHDNVLERLHLKADLVRALERDELHLHYQPVVALEDGSLLGYEALLRWEHPERGPVSPATFVPLAEETGLIIPIGTWVLHAALDQLHMWQRTRPPHDRLRMEVNLSPRQLAEPTIVEQVSKALQAANVDPASVVIELTESASIDDDPAARRRLGEIRDLGVGIYADDFGTGYASYASLRSLPFTGVKIDRSLIDGIDGHGGAQAQAQVRSILEMANELGLATVAEGVETAEQVQVLRQLGCDIGQGYYFARPSPSGALEREPQPLDSSNDPEHGTEPLDSPSASPAG